VVIPEASEEPVTDPSSTPSDHADDTAPAGAATPPSVEVEPAAEDAAAGSPGPRGVSTLTAIAIALISGLVGLTIGTTMSPSGDPSPDAAASEAVSAAVLDTRPALGSADAPVTIELYSDFGCPYCQRHDRDVEPELIAQYVESGQARIEWYDVPFQGPASVQLAVAARAAERQDRFWEYKDAVFATDGRDASDERLREFAVTAGLDVERFERDLADPALELAVRRDLERAQAVGVRATPSFLIAGEPLVGAQPLAAFVPVIDDALAAAG
jgi:protein-disulfide isomerase